MGQRVMHNLDWSETAGWRARFKVGRVLWAQVATQNTAHGLTCIERDSVAQLYAWHVQDGTLRQITHADTGVEQGYISADGLGIYVLAGSDEAGLGHYLRLPFAEGNARDISADMPPYASFYLTESHSGNLLGYSAAAPEWGFRIYVQDQSSKILFTYESEDFCVGPNLSYDGAIAVIANADPHNNWAFSLEAYEVASGQKLGQLKTSSAGGVHPIGFVPRAGDERYLATTQHNGKIHPIIWNPRTGERRDLTLDFLMGDLDAWDWSDDGRYLLLNQRYQARHQLYLYDLDADSIIKLTHPSGSYSAASFVGDTIHATMQSATQPACVLELDRMTGQQQRILLSASPTPDSHRWQSVEFPSADSVSIQAWLMKPAGEGPFPALVHAHGGPDAVVTERFDPSLQAWVDQGFAVLSVNYRGSTTFGADFTQAIIGQPGTLELEDLVGAANWLVTEQIAHASQIFLTGASYGGYLTLQTLSHRPSIFAGGLAIVPITDWTDNYATTDETLQQHQQQLFGGNPQTKAASMREASPITHAEALQAPILVLQAKNDSRYPAQQIRSYVEKLKSLEKPVELHWFDAETTALRASEHVALMMRFVDRVLKQASS